MRLPTEQRRTLAFVAALVLSAPASALAANITVDGSVNDWAQVTTCFDERAGDGQNGIDLVRLCVTDNNSSGNTGSLFTLYEAQTNFPNSFYVGFVFDKNKDGQLDSQDEVFALAFTSGATPSMLYVYRYENYSQPLRQYAPGATCGGSSGTRTWSGRRNGRYVEMAVGYGCLGLSYGDDIRMVQTGTYPNFDLSPEALYDGTNETLEMLVRPPPVGAFTAVSRSSGTTLYWTNPSQHRGVLILRRSSAFPSFTPQRGRRYNAGENLGNGIVVAYADDNSAASSWTDTAAAGTNYYVIFNHHQNHTYSLVEPSSGGLKTVRPGTASTEPEWCYSTGFASLMQPVTDLGVGIFHAGNSGLISANRTTPGVPSTDGAERWRPYPANPIQARFPVVQIGDGRRLIFTGDQSGYTYALDATTGAIAWTGPRVGTSIQAQPAVQLAAYSNAAFRQARQNRDLVFFVARDNASPRVVARYADNGAQAWSANISGLGTVSGGMVVDYNTNRLWIPSSGGSGDRLRVLDTTNGNAIGTVNTGDSTHAVNYDFKSNQIYVTGTANTGANNQRRLVRGVDAVTRNIVWSYQLPSLATTWVFPTGNGFIASLSDGTVRRYAVDGTSVSQLWSRSISGPSGVTIDYATQRVYVGGSNGSIYELDASNGAIVRQVAVPGGPGALGTPTIDSTARRLHVGTLDGRVCAFNLPL